MKKVEREKTSIEKERTETKVEDSPDCEDCAREAHEKKHSDENQEEQEDKRADDGEMEVKKEEEQYSSGGSSSGEEQADDQKEDHPDLQMQQADDSVENKESSNVSDEKKEEERKGIMKDRQVSDLSKRKPLPGVVTRENSSVTFANPVVKTDGTLTKESSYTLPDGTLPDGPLPDSPARSREVSQLSSGKNGRKKKKNMTGTVPEIQTAVERYSQDWQPDEKTDEKADEKTDEKTDEKADEIDEKKDETDK